MATARCAAAQFGAIRRNSLRPPPSPLQVTKAEFVRAIPKLGIEAEAFEIEQLFGFFDPDNDGSIELKELSKKLKGPSAAFGRDLARELEPVEAALRTADASEARVRKAWDAYDVDASDSIDLGEVMSLMDDLGVAAEGLARVGLVAQRAGEAAPGCAVAGGGCGRGHRRRGVVHAERYDAPGGRRRCRIPLCVGFQEYLVRRLKSNLRRRSRCEVDVPL